MKTKPQEIKDDVEKMAGKEKTQAVLDNPITLLVAHRIIRRLCRSCRYKVVNGVRNKSLPAKSALCSSCIRIWDLEEERGGLK